MKKAAVLLFILAAFAAGFYLKGHPWQTIVHPGATEPIGVPADYFPLATGSTWNYDITTTNVKALHYQVCSWPGPDSHEVVMASRGVFWGGLVSGPKTYPLSLRIDGPGQPDASIKWEGVKVKVLVDSLGVYEDHNGIIWVPLSGSEFQIAQIVTYPPSTPGAPSGPWGSWNAGNGYELRHLFFGAAPLTTMSFGGDQSEDALQFIGIESFSVGQYSGPTMHFRRTVKPGTTETKALPKAGDLEEGFTEDTWFIQHVGLAKLVQTINGHVSMTWTLASFTPGS